jgi:hypothetical protein
MSPVQSVTDVPVHSASALRLCSPPLRYALSTLAIASFQGWEIPLPFQLLPPAFARWRPACRYMPRMA